MKYLTTQTVWCKFDFTFETLHKSPELKGRNGLVKNKRFDHFHGLTALALPHPEQSICLIRENVSLVFLHRHLWISHLFTVLPVLARSVEIKLFFFRSWIIKALISFYFWTDIWWIIKLRQPAKTNAFHLYSYPFGDEIMNAYWNTKHILVSSVFSLWRCRKHFVRFCCLVLTASGFADADSLATLLWFIFSWPL